MRMWLVIAVPSALFFGSYGCQPQDSAGATDAAPTTTTEAPGEPSTGAPSEPTTGGTTIGTTAATTESPPDTTGATDGTTTLAGPYCGDGHVDPGEACDDGPNNADDAACTMQCESAMCGDGLVWAGVEACDFGAGNSNEYGGCDACQFGPRCGDGVLDVGHEECDLGDELNGTGMAEEGQGACWATCRWQGRLVFLTSATYSGALGGLDGADIRCRNLAKEAGMEGANTFRAWLSDANQSPNTRFQQIALTDAPYILPNGRIVAASFAELVEDGPRTGIAVTETGEAVFNHPVWTNTTGLGNPLSPVDHCAGWTSASQQLSSHFGLNALALEDGPAWENWKSERLWTVLDKYPCHNAFRLYCVEDGYEPED